MGKKKRKYLRVSDPNFVCQDRISFTGSFDLYITRNIRKRYSGVIINENTEGSFKVLIETSYAYHAAPRTLQPGASIELRDFPLSRIVFQGSGMFTVLVWATEKPEAFVRTTVPIPVSVTVAPTDQNIIKWGGTPVTGRNITPDIQALSDPAIQGLMRSVGDTGAAPSNVTGETTLKKLDRIALATESLSAAHALLSVTHPDTLPASVVAGDLIFGNATPKWARLAKATDGQILTLASGLPAWAAPAPSGNFQLVSEQILASAQTDVDFTGLNINTNKCYMLFWNIKNPLGTVCAYYLYVNGDYVDTNYYSQYLFATGTSVSAARQNSPEFSQAPSAGDRCAGFLAVFRDPDGYARWKTSEVRGTGSAVEFLDRANCKTATVTNITSLRVHSGSAGGLGIGTRLALYKVTGA